MGFDDTEDTHNAPQGRQLGMQTKLKGDSQQETAQVP